MAKSQIVLKELFGEEAELKSLQVEALTHLSLGKNIFVSFPTGYGKSLCFWMPAKAWGWRVIVVSPLLALMEDQRISCQALGIDPVLVHSGQSKSERSENEIRLWAGNWNLCFLSPEQLMLWEENGLFHCIRRQGVDLLAIDEMHCIEDWRGFRLSYSEIFNPIRRLLSSGSVLLGLSASMRREDSVQWMLEFCDDFDILDAGLGRENLSLAVLPLEEERDRWILLAIMLRDLKESESALVYCSTREESDGVSRWLSSCGWNAAAYHAGLPPKLRLARLQAFRQGNLNIVCATTAFGMGVDFPRVRKIVHFSMPYSLAAYWQEVGRAGRDNLPAQAIAFWRRSEVLRARHLSGSQKENFLALWLAWKNSSCRKATIAIDLGRSEAPCGNCDLCWKHGKGELPFWFQVFSPWFEKNIWWLKQESNFENWLKEKFSKN